MTSDILIPIATTLITGAIVGLVGYLLAIYRADPKQLKEDISSMREETKKELFSMREENRREFLTLRKEVSEEFREARAKMDSISDRLAHLEGATGTGRKL